MCLYTYCHKKGPATILQVHYTCTYAHMSTSTFTRISMLIHTHAYMHTVVTHTHTQLDLDKNPPEAGDALLPRQTESNHQSPSTATYSTLVPAHILMLHKKSMAIGTYIPLEY